MTRNSVVSVYTSQKHSETGVVSIHPNGIDESPPPSVPLIVGRRLDVVLKQVRATTRQRRGLRLKKREYEAERSCEDATLSAL